MIILITNFSALRRKQSHSVRCGPVLPGGLGRSGASAGQSATQPCGSGSGLVLLHGVVGVDAQVGGSLRGGRLVTRVLDRVRSWARL